MFGSVRKLQFTATECNDYSFENNASRIIAAWQIKCGYIIILVVELNGATTFIGSDIAPDPPTLTLVKVLLNCLTQAFPILLLVHFIPASRK